MVKERKVKNKLNKKMQMNEIARLVCRTEGHKIGVLAEPIANISEDTGKTMLGWAKRTICTSCGATLEEIRGEA